MKCLACGVEKDMAAKEVYPYPEDDCLCDDPIEPILETDCEGEKEFRVAFMCHECWHQLFVNTNGIDMWISKRCWETLNPVTPFDQLPPWRDRRKERSCLTL